MMYYNQLETGRRIQKLRRERYLTQEELAIKLNISDRHLRNLERGEYTPSIDLFVEIAAFFDVTLDHLIMGKALSDHEEHLRNKLHQKRLANQKLSLKLQRVAQNLPQSLKNCNPHRCPSGQAALKAACSEGLFCIFGFKIFFGRNCFFHHFLKIVFFVEAMFLHQNRK